MGLFGAEAFSPQALMNASNAVNGQGMGQQDALKKLIQQIMGHGFKPSDVTIPQQQPLQQMGGGLMSLFGG